MVIFEDRGVNPSAVPGWFVQHLWKGSKASRYYREGFSVYRPMNFSNMHYICVLYSVAADRYYVGYSSDPWKRLEQHLTNRGEKYTGSFYDRE